MTVHAVEIVCSTGQADNPSTVPAPEPPDLVDVLPERVNQNVFDTLTEALPGQSMPATIVNTEPDGTGTDHIKARYRVDGGHDKATVLDELEKGAVADAEWYEIRMHECDHDEPDNQRTGCPGWTVERSSGIVPGDV